MIILDAVSFIKWALSARNIQVLPIIPEIAYLSSSHETFIHQDPADRLIAATTIYHKGSLVTCDSLLLKIKDLPTISVRRARL